MEYSISLIPTGEAGTDRTVAAMVSLVEASQRSPGVRNAALSVIRPLDLDSRKPLSVARALFHWVRTHIKYVYDPVDVETIQGPVVTLGLRAGDCDDHAILVAALFESVGLPARFRVVGPAPSEFQHVFAEVLVGGSWLSADTVESNQVGRSMGRFGAEKIYTHNEDSYMQGINTAYAPDLARRVANRATTEELSRQWAAKMISRRCIFRAISDSSTSSGISDPNFRAGAVQAMRSFLDAHPVDQYVPPGNLAGLGVFGGLIGAITGAVKGAWDGIKDIVTGGGSPPPPVVVPPSPWTGFLSGPIPWVLGGAAVILALRIGR